MILNLKNMIKNNKIMNKNLKNFDKVYLSRKIMLT